MRTATFLFLRTGLNLFKPGVQFNAGLAETSFTDGNPDVVGIQSPESSPSVNDEMNDRGGLKLVDSETIHIGPRGGRYRLDEAGRKIYLKAA